MTFLLNWIYRHKEYRFRRDWSVGGQ
ncbi:phage holin family protein [Sodalis glossinidius]|nr:phage holin family protein [Sodalis glossinidius]